MQNENLFIEYKSLKKVVGKSKNLKDLAKTCVSLANSQGGTIFIGIEDKEKEPPLEQKIKNEDIDQTIKELRRLTDSVGIINQKIHKHQNGGEFFSIKIVPSQKTIATTTDGKVYIRVSDECKPVSSYELTRLASEKEAFQWEMGERNIYLKDINYFEVSKFVDEIKKSTKVSPHIKSLDSEGILAYYNFLSENNKLTNIGILWLGSFMQRSRLSYPITVQYIVYNDLGEKIRKVEWHDNLLNPKDLLLDIEEKATELNYSTELPDGMFRKAIRHYSKEVIRELLVNAFAHKSYTISGDIFIELYTDRLEISSPGNLPMGITKSNILHTRFRRNPHIINVLSALNLMEGEGSGFDLIYEKLSQDAKEYPVIINDYDYVKVTIYSNIIDIEIIKILDTILKHYKLSQKEIITIGIIAREKRILPTDLTKTLQLKEDERLRSWIGKLVTQEIVLKQGKGKGTYYSINPKILSTVDYNIKPTLKTMELHVLEALILEDLKIHPNSKVSEIETRLKDAGKKEIQKILYKLKEDKKLSVSGGRAHRNYSLSH